jgi:hypothetical protein
MKSFPARPILALALFANGIMPCFVVPRTVGTAVALSGRQVILRWPHFASSNSLLGHVGIDRVVRRASL